jgi:uncharacterized protein
MKNKYKELIRELSDKELLFQLYLTQLIIIALALVVGMIIYKDIQFIGDFFRWSDQSILTIGVPVGLIVVIIDLSFMKILPNSFYDDGGLNERIFKNRNIFHIAFIAFIVAFSEELLFRGIIQTQLGLVAASLIFAVIHFRYLFNWFLFSNIVILSFLIGYIFDLTENLSVTIVIHFIIDFSLGYLIMKKKIHKK